MLSCRTGPDEEWLCLEKAKLDRRLGREVMTMQGAVAAYKAACCRSLVVHDERAISSTRQLTLTQRLGREKEIYHTLHHEDVIDASTGHLGSVRPRSKRSWLSTPRTGKSTSCVPGGDTGDASGPSAPSPK